MIRNLLQNIRIQAILVFIIAGLQYANTSDHAYAWDDAIVITENTRVQKGLKNVSELFENIKTNETQNRYGYRPISLLSFATDVQLFGLNPKASHKVNIVLYGLLSVLVLMFSNMLFPDRKIETLLITLLFTVHPLHTEVVANIKSRDEILALGFGLLGLMSYYRGLVSNVWHYKLLSLLFFIMAFLSKESAVTLLGVALTMPWAVFDPTRHWAHFKKSLTVIGFFAVIIAIRIFVYSDAFFQSNDFELQQKGILVQDGFVGNPLVDATWSQRIATAVFLICYFVFRFFVPYPLLHDYSYNQFQVQNFQSPVVWIALPILIGLTIIMLHGFANRRPHGFGVAFFLITCSVYLHVVQMAPDIFAERFLFVPSLGICISFLTLFEMHKIKTPIMAAAAILLIPMFSYGMYRNNAWQDNRTLLETDLPNLENCVRANYNYALFLHSEYYGLPPSAQAAAKGQILFYYEHTMELTDRLFNVYIDLGSAYMEFGHPDKAHAIFSAAAEKYGHLSLPWVQLGKYHMSFQEYSKAVPYFKRAIQNGSKNSDYHYLLAICLFNSGWYEEAINTMLEGERFGVSSPGYHSLLARLYAKLGEIQDARHALERGLNLYPQDLGLLQSLEQLDQQP